MVPAAKIESMPLATIKLIARPQSWRIPSEENAQISVTDEITIRLPQQIGNGALLRFIPISVQNYSDGTFYVRFETRAEESRSYRTFHASLARLSNGEVQLYFESPQYSAGRKAGRLVQNIRFDGHDDQHLIDSLCDVLPELEKRITREHQARENTAIAALRAQFNSLVLERRSRMTISNTFPKTHKEQKAMKDLSKRVIELRDKLLQSAY